MRVLVVTNPFGDHAKGDRIADPQEIAKILSGGHQNHVVQADHADAHSATADAPEFGDTITEEA